VEEILGGVPWPQAIAATGGWVLAFFFVGLVYRGRLIPRSTHDEVVHDRNEWRAESRIKDQQIAEKDTQLAHLRQVGETQIATWGKLRQIAEEKSP
jgi:hypothetical protein